MPGAIGKLIVDAIFVVAKAFAGGYGATVAFLSKAAGVALLSSVTNKLFGPKLPQDAGLSGQQLMTRSAVEYRKLVYGQAMVSGPVVYNNLTGSNGEYLWYVVALAHGETDDFVSVWFDGDEILKADIDWTAGTGGADGTGTGDVSTSKWIGENSTNAAQLFYYLGHADQVVSAKLSAGFPADWNSSHRGRGVTYLVAKLLYNEDTAEVWKSGPPGNIKALIKGRKLYDPRLDSTVVITNVDDNLVLYSEQADNAAWLKGACTVDANAGTDPDGGGAADRINVTASTSEHRVTQLVTNTTAGNTYTASAYVKDDGAGFATMSMAEGGEDFYSATFDLSDGSVTKTDVGTSGGVIDASGASYVGDGWYRLWIKGNTSSGGANSIYSYVAASDSGTFTGNTVGVNSYLASAGDDLLIWGMQVNNGSLGEYAQTTSSAITDTLGSGSHRYTDSSTWEWSDNPALCTADYLFNVMDVDAASSIDWPSIATAADYCDELVDVGPAASPTNTQKRFTCNGVASLGQSHKDNLDSIISSCDGKLSYTAGVWKLRASQWEASSVSITASDLAGDIEVRGAAPKSERFNLVRGFFIDPDRKYESTEFPHVSASSYLTRDAGQTITYDLALPFTNNQYMAQRIAYRLLEQGDNQLVCTLVMNERGAKVAIGDVVDITLDDYSWSAKTFRCVDWERASNGTFKVTFREDDSGDYVDPLVAEYQDVNSADPATEISIVPAPTGLAATPILNGVKLTWTDPASRLYDRIEIWQSSSDSLSGASQIATVSGSPFIDVVSESQNKRYYWIRAVRNSGAASSYEPNNSPDTGVGAFPLIGETNIVKDPWMRQGAGAFLYDSDGWGATASTTYVDGGGSDGTDCLRATIPNPFKIFQFTPDQRLGPDEFDAVIPGDVSIQIQFRWRKTTHGAGATSSPIAPYTIYLGPIAQTYESSGTNAQNYGSLNTSGTILDETSALNVWHNDAAIIRVNDSSQTGFRHFRVGLQLYGTGGSAALDGAVIEVDYINASIVSSEFLGANKPGIVPNPTTEVGAFLRDDGSFARPHSSYNALDSGATGDGATDDTAALQSATDAATGELFVPAGDYLVSKTSSYTTEFPNGDQPCLFVKDKTNLTIRGEAGTRFLVNEHAQGIIEMQGCTDCEIIGIEFVGPGDFPQIDGTTGLAEKGDASNGYNTASIWGQDKNNSNDTSSNTGGGFSGAFPQYGSPSPETAATWGTWNGGYIGNVSYGLLIQKDCDRITVRNCKASGFNYVGFGVGHPGDASYTTNTDIKFLDCVSIDNYSAGIHSLAVDGLIVRGCTLNDNGHPDFDYTTDTYADPGYGYTARGVATYYTKNAVISNNLVQGNNRKGLDSHASERLQFVNNTIRDCAAMAISVPWTSTTQPVKQTIVKGNIIQNCSYAITNLSAIIGGGPVSGYSYADSLCDLIISENIIEDCGANDIEIKNGRNIQITNNILRGFDDRSSGSKYFMFLGRVSTNEPIYNLNCSGNICDADGDTSRYRGISVRYAHNSQVNHNMMYMDHSSASTGIDLHQCGTVQAFGNMVYVDSGATSSVPINLLSTDAFTVGNYSDPDVGSLSYPFGNEGTSGEKEHAVKVPHIIQLDITYTGGSPILTYVVNAGEDYVDDVIELATYGTQVTFKNIHSTATLRSSMITKSSSGITAGAGDVNFIYERAISNTALEIGVKTEPSGTNITASNCTGGVLSVTVLVF